MQFLLRLLENRFLDKLSISLVLEAEMATLTMYYDQDVVFVKELPILGKMKTGASDFKPRSYYFWVKEER